MEFNQIRYFLNLTDILNFTEAAQRSGVSPTCLLEPRTPPRKDERLQDKIEAQLARLKAAPRLIRSFFRAPSVAYITDW